MAYYLSSPEKVGLIRERGLTLEGGLIEDLQCYNP